MNRNLLRGTLYGCGLSAFAWALALSFWVSWYPVLIIAGMLMVLVGGFIERDNDDDGYDDTVYGPPYVNVIQFPERAPVATETIHTPPQAWTIIEGGKKAVWPNEIGGVE